MTNSSRLSAFCDKVIEAGWLAAVVLVPLFFNVYSSRVFEPDKLTLLRSIALLMIGAWAIRWLEERGRNGDRTDRVRWSTPMILPTVLLIGVYLVASLLSIVPRVSFLGSYQRLQGTYTLLSYVVIFWMIVLNMRRREQLDRIITAIVMTSLPIAFYGLLQHGDGTRSIDPLPWGGDVTSRVASNMGNPIFVAAYLIMAFLLTLGRVVESFRVILTEKESRISDILRASSYVFIAAVQLITIWFANSRGPFLGLGAGIFLFVLVSLLMLRTAAREAGRLNVPKAAIAAGVALAAAALGAAAGYLIVGRIIGRGDPLAPLEWAILGAIGGGVIIVLLLATLRKTWGWLWLSWVTMTLIAVAILGVINISNAQVIDDLRSTKIIGPLARLLESESGTGQVRSLIWQGAVKLIQPHDPLKFPDGTADGLNIIRPLIGYGPESMYVAYNPFYPPDLAHIEARNASPDRSHNETLDAFVTTGLIGFLAEQFLFISVFYFGLKWLGLMSHRLAKYLFAGAWIIGSLIGAIVLTSIKGLNFLGVGLPAGAVGGMILYLIVYSLFLYQPQDVEAAHGHQILLVALLAAVLAHFVEIHFGIAIAATRTYFWTYVGLLVVAGLHWVPADEESEVTAPAMAAPASAADNKPSELPPVPQNKKKARRTATAAAAAKREARPNPWVKWFGAVLALALVGALVLGTLGYEFINSSPNAGPASSVTQLITNSLTRLPYQDNQVSYGALLMFTVTWLFGGLLGLTELRRRNLLSAKDVWPAAGVYYGVSLGVALIFWLLLAGQLISLGSFVQPTQIRTLQDYAQRTDELLALANAVSNILTLFYLYVAVVIFGMAAALMMADRSRYLKFSNSWGLAVAVPIGLAVLIGVVTTNLNTIRADIVYKQAEAMRTSGQWDVAIAHYKLARELNPDEDFYYLWLGAAYLEKATNAPGSASIITAASNLNDMLGLSFEQTYGLNQQDTLHVAQAVLEQARSLNPLNTDHTANLARLHRRAAELAASDPAARQKELETSSDFYQQATSLSPNNAQLWNEWATVYLSQSDLARQKGDNATADSAFKEAQARLDRSLKLDQQYDQTYLLLAQVARTLGQPDEVRRNLELALKVNPGSLDAWGGLIEPLVSQANYTEAERITLAFLNTNPNSLPALRTLARNIYYPQNRIAEAIATAQRVIELDTNDSNAWDDQRVLAVLLAQAGRIPEALQAAQAALSAAPQDKQTDLQNLVKQLQGGPGASSVPTVTLPLTKTSPQP